MMELNKKATYCQETWIRGDENEKKTCEQGGGECLGM